MNDDDHITEMTTIAISRKTRDILKKYGHKGESYDSLLIRLLNDINISLHGD